MNQYKTHGPHGESGMSWNEYFKQMKAKAKVEAVPETTETVMSSEVISEAELAGKALELYKKSHPFERRMVGKSVVHTSDTYYMGDDRKGELRKPAHDTTYYWISAKSGRLGFTARYVEQPTPKGARGFKFVDAKTHGNEVRIYTKAGELDAWLAEAIKNLKSEEE